MYALLNLEEIKNIYIYIISVVRFKSASDSKIDSFLLYCTYCMNKGLEVIILFHACLY